MHLAGVLTCDKYTCDRDPYLAGTPVTEIPTWQVHQWQRSLHDRYTCDRSLLDRYTCDRIPTWQVHQWQRSLTSTPVTEIPIWQVHLWQTSIPDKYTCDRDPYLTDTPLTGRGSYLTSTPVTEIPTWQVHQWQRSLPDKYIWQGGVPTWQRSLPDRYTCDRDPYLTSTPLTGVPWGDEGLSIFVVAGVVITSLTHWAALARHLTGSLTPGGWTPVTLVSAHNLTWTNRDE